MPRPAHHLAASLSCLLVACPGDGKTDTQDPTGETSHSTGAASSTTAATGDTSDTGVDASTAVVTAADTGSATTTTATTTAATTGDLPDGACRSDADCAAQDEQCFAPGEANCGDCQGPSEPCVLDRDCADGTVCAPFVASCPCDPTARGCVPKCDGDCGPAATCDPDSGQCVPLTCSQDDLACPPHFHCAPGSGADDCERDTCAADDECDGGFCVESRCHDGLGHCSPLAP